MQSVLSLFSKLEQLRLSLIWGFFLISRYPFLRQLDQTFAVDLLHICTLCVQKDAFAHWKAY